MQNRLDWTPRYLIHNNDLLAETIAEDAELVKQFGAFCVGFCPGVIIQIGEGGGAASVSLNDAAWNWLRPLLKELSDRRKEDTKDG